MTQHTREQYSCNFCASHSTSDIKKIAEENKNVHISQLDVKDFAKYDNLAAKIKSVVGDSGLNMLINVAGIQNFPTLEEIKAEELINNYMINTVAPILLTKAMLSLLKQAAVANSDKPVSIERAAIVNVSSKLGSIAENTGGAKYPYRCSKAAQNAATKSMSIDLKDDNILCVAMHPGWVQTFMGGEGALIDTETSINGFFNTLGALTEKDSGKFLQYDGVEIPW